MYNHWYVTGLTVTVNMMIFAAQVHHATACNIPFLGTSGQHGFSIDLSRLQNGMEIDMSAFRNVSVDAKAKTFTVGGGVRFSDVLDPVFNAGKEISKLKQSSK